MTQYAVFENLGQYQAFEATAYAAWMQGRSNQKYIAQTKRWSNPFQRLTDNKYIAVLCPRVSDNTPYTLEESDPSWFPTDSGEI